MVNLVGTHWYPSWQLTVYKMVRLVHLVGSNLITLVHHYGFYIWCIKRIYDIQSLVILILIKILENAFYYQIL